MKKNYFKTLALVASILIAGSTALVSCTKDLDDKVDQLEIKNSAAAQSIADLTEALSAQKTSLEAALASQNSALTTLINEKASKSDINLATARIADLESLVEKLQKEVATVEQIEDLQTQIDKFEEGMLTVGDVEEIIKEYGFLDAQGLAALFADETTDAYKAVNAMISAVTTDIKDQADANKLAIEKLAGRVGLVETAIADLEAALAQYSTIEALDAKLLVLNNSLTAEINWIMTKVNTIELTADMMSISGGTIGAKVEFDGVTYEKDQIITEAVSYTIPVMINPNGNLPANATWSVRSLTEVMDIDVSASFGSKTLKAVATRAENSNGLHTLNFDFSNFAIQEGDEYMERLAVQLIQTNGNAVNKILTAYDLVFLRSPITSEALVVDNYSNVFMGGDVVEAKLDVLYDTKVYKTLATIDYKTTNAKFKGNVTGTPADLKAGKLLITSPVKDGKYTLEGLALTVDIAYLDYTGVKGTKEHVMYCYQELNYGTGVLPVKTVTIAEEADVIKYDLNALFSGLSPQDLALIQSNLIRVAKPTAKVKDSKGADVSASLSPNVVSFDKAYTENNLTVQIPASTKAGTYVLELTFVDNTLTEDNEKTFKAEFTVVKPNYDGVVGKIDLWWINDVVNVVTAGTSSNLNVDLLDVFTFKAPKGSTIATKVITFDQDAKENEVIIPAEKEGDEDTSGAPAGVSLNDSMLSWRGSDANVGDATPVMSIGKEFTFVLTVTMGNGDVITKKHKVKFVNSITVSNMAYVANVPAIPNQVSPLVSTFNGKVQDVNLEQLVTIKDSFGKVVGNTTWTKAVNVWSAVTAYTEYAENLYGDQFVPANFPTNTTFEIVGGNEAKSFETTATGVKWINVARPSADVIIQVVAVTEHYYGTIKSAPVNVTMKK